jgi:hypothetical protein
MMQRVLFLCWVHLVLVRGNCDPGSHTEVDGEILSCKTCLPNNYCPGCHNTDQCQYAIIDKLGVTSELISYSHECPANMKSSAGQSYCVPNTADDENLCKQVPGGMYWNNATNICVVCPKGYRCVEGLMYVCMAGTYSDMIGSYLCKPCAIGRVSTSTGAVECSNCLGQVTDASKTCSVPKENCEPGQFFQNNQCTDCPVDTFSLTPADQCTPCTPGSTTGNRIKALNCSTCTAQYEFNTVFGDCRECNGGFDYNSIEKKCTRCREGYYSPDGKGCLLCTGRVSYDQTLCLKCERRNPLTPNVCSCDAGFALDYTGLRCVQCDIGMYRTADMPPNRCLACQSGKYWENQQCHTCDNGKSTGLTSGNDRKACVENICPACAENGHVRMCAGTLPGGHQLCVPFRNLLPGSTGWGKNWYRAPHLQELARMNMDSTVLAFSKNGMHVVRSKQNQVDVLDVKGSGLTISLSLTWQSTVENSIAFVWAAELQDLIVVGKNGMVNMITSSKVFENVLGESLWNLDGNDLGDLEEGAGFECVACPRGEFVCVRTNAKKESMWWWFTLKMYGRHRYVRAPDVYPGIKAKSLTRQNNRIFYIAQNNSCATYFDLPVTIDQTYDFFDNGLRERVEMCTDDLTITNLTIVNNKWFEWQNSTNTLNMVFSLISEKRRWGVGVGLDTTSSSWRFDQDAMLATTEDGVSTNTLLDFDFLPMGVIVVMTRVEPTTVGINRYHHVQLCPIHSHTDNYNAISIQDCICDDGFYRDVDNTTCVKCSEVCSSNYYEAQMCTSTSDIVCKMCSGVCNQGQYIESPCSQKSDIICQTCTKVQCGGLQYAGGDCDGSGTTNALKCIDCTNCPRDHYRLDTRSGCNESGINQNCEPCGNKLSCPAGTYRTDRCSGLTLEDTEVCTACPPCPVGQYHTQGCDGTTYHNQSTCRLCDRCPSGTYTESFNGCLGFLSSPQAYTCTNCTLECPNGTVPDPPCTGAYVATLKCIVCDDLECNPGEFIKVDGGTCTCQECQASSQCQAGIEYINPFQCDGHGLIDENCLPCTTKCNVGEVIKDNFQCTSGHIGNEAHCVKCDENSCNSVPGSYVDTSMCTGDNSAGTQCKPRKICPTNWYRYNQSYDRDTTCKQCSTCESGSWEDTQSPCSGAQDTVCSTCDLTLAKHGYYLWPSVCLAGHTFHEPALITCGICRAGEIMTHECTAYTDTVCQTAVGKLNVKLHT